MYGHLLACITLPFQALQYACQRAHNIHKLLILPRPVCTVLQYSQLVYVCHGAAFPAWHLLYCSAVALERTAWQSPVDAGAISERGKLQVCCQCLNLLLTVTRLAT